MFADQRATWTSPRTPCPTGAGGLELVVAEIAARPLDEGWVFATAGAEVIREEAAYSGVRVCGRRPRRFGAPQNTD
jgi:hypothetical protein